MSQSCLSNGGVYLSISLISFTYKIMTHPARVLNHAFGVKSFGRPEKLINLGPPQFSDPIPASHINTSSHAFSLTALCIGTTVRMSSLRGL